VLIVLLWAFGVALVNRAQVGASLRVWCEDVAGINNDKIESCLNIDIEG
jgi:hypothetical protein